VGAMTFGWEATLRCLQDLAMRGPGGEAVCLAHKFTVRHIVGPVYLTDDGYVIKAVKGSTYHPLEAQEITELQASGTLPNPLPRYSLSAFDYLAGYGLWVILACAIALVTVGARARRRTGLTASEPPISQQPVARTTEGDRFIAAQVSQQLRPRERVTHQAYALSADTQAALINIGVTGYFAVLTDQRLILIKTRLSPFRVRLENRGLEALDRAVIVGAHRNDCTVSVLLRDGSTRLLAIDPRTKRFSNQVAFLLDVPRLLAPAATAPMA
jgi:hypothetical protein